MPVISVFTQEVKDSWIQGFKGHGFKASFGYTMRCCLKNQNKTDRSKKKKKLHMSLPFAVIQDYINS